MKRIIAVFLVLCSVVYGGVFGPSGGGNIYTGRKPSNSLTVYPGDDLQFAYDRLKSANNDGRMGEVSEINPRVLLRTPGNYTDDLSVDTKYVYVSYPEGTVDSGDITYTTAWYGDIIGDGSGDDLDNAINIDSPQAWNAMANAGADDDYYLQTADIDFSSVLIGLIHSNANLDNTYNGDSYVIKNGTIKETVTLYNALFGQAESTTIIKGVVTRDIVSVFNTSNSTSPGIGYCAVLVAEAEYGCVISNCDINGSVKLTATETGASTKGIVGMIAGSNHGTVQNCKASGRVEGATTLGANDSNYFSLGGGVGYQVGGTGSAETVRGFMDNVRVTTNVVFNSPMYADAAFIGGICGSVQLQNSQTNYISNCTFDGTINFNDTLNDDTQQRFSYIGGICGQMNSAVFNCSAKGYIFSANAGEYNSGSGHRGYTGGLFGSIETSKVASDCWGDMTISVGYNAADKGMDLGGLVSRHNGGTITDCYFKGSFYDLITDSTAIACRSCAGGITLNTGTATDCFVAIDTYTGGGGFTNFDSGTITTCYWDETTSGITAAGAGGTKQTTTQLYTNPVAGFDYTVTTGHWKQVDGYEYPKLSWEN